MTELLKKVIAEIEKLPEDSQDAIAKRLITDLRDEKEWTDRFESTTDSQWNRIAEMVRQEIAEKKTAPLDERFPDRDSQS